MINYTPENLILAPAESEQGGTLPRKLTFWGG